MLNVPFLRAVQASIADTSRPFDMARWQTCIYGHAATVAGMTLPPWGADLSTIAQMAGKMGLSFDTARKLFNENRLDEREHRAVAIARIDALIDREAGTAARDELVVEELALA